MASRSQPDTDADDVATDAGSSTDQHVTGTGETGTFTTDEPPTADTPAHGSGNAGVNEPDGERPASVSDQ
jgi:hypothetical protein